MFFEFRPLEDWRGEFGFDWLRENDDDQVSYHLLILIGNSL